MLNKTSQSAIQALLYLSVNKTKDPVSHRLIAEEIGSSPTYMAKVINHLVKADILRAFQGVHGGVMLSREPEKITLLEAVEACQGKVNKDYCSEHSVERQVCAFHRAMTDLYKAINEALSRWTLADISKKPNPSKAICDLVDCKMKNVCPLE